MSEMYKYIYDDDDDDDASLLQTINNNFQGFHFCANKAHMVCEASAEF
jgi:hypothetical protein